MRPLRFLVQSLLIALKTTSVYRHINVNKSKIFNSLGRKNIIFGGKTVINIEIFQNNISDYSFLRKSLANSVYTQLLNLRSKI